MKNNKIYIITIILSIILMSLDVITGNCLGGILSGIGCSGVTAAIMAIFIDKSNNRYEQKRKDYVKKMYLHNFVSCITTLIGELIWLDEMIDDDKFNWDLNDDKYEGLNFVIYSAEISKTRTISYNEAMQCLNCIAIKYNKDGIEKLDEAKKLRVCKMFRIASKSTVSLLKEFVKINDNALLLELEGLITRSDLERIRSEIVVFYGIVTRNDKNYHTAIKCLQQVLNSVCEFIGERPDIEVGPNSCVSILGL